MPRFKKKGVKSSFRVNAVRSNYKGTSYCNIKVDLNSRTITLPKLGNVKIRGYRNLREFNSKILTIVP